MKPIRLLHCAVLLACFVSVSQPGHADSVQLKDGTIIEGNISSETDTNLVIDIHIGTGTVVGRTIDKAEVTSVTRATPEQKRARAMAEAYRKLQVYQLNPTNIYTAAYYDQVIDKVFQPFLAAYPDATQANDVRLRLAAWEAERQQVAAGNIKRNGRWIPVAEAKTLDDQARLDQLTTQAQSFLSKKQFDKAIPILESLQKNESDADRKTNLDRQIEQAYKDWVLILQAAQNKSTETIQRLKTKIDIADKARIGAEDTYRNSLERYQSDSSAALGLRAELAIQLETLNKHEAELKALNKQLSQAEQFAGATSNSLAKANSVIDAYQSARDHAAHLAALEKARLDALAKLTNETAALEPFEVPTITKTQEVNVLAAPVQPPKPAPAPPPKADSFAVWLEQNWIIAGIGAILTLGFFLKILRK
jgi:hypothetical protein